MCTCVGSAYNERNALSFSSQYLQRSWREDQMYLPMSFCLRRSCRFSSILNRAPPNWTAKENFYLDKQRPSTSNIMQLRPRCIQASIILPDPPHMDNTQCTNRNQLETRTHTSVSPRQNYPTISTRGFFERIEWLSRRLEKTNDNIPYQDCLEHDTFSWVHQRWWNFDETDDLTS